MARIFATANKDDAKNQILLQLRGCLIENKTLIDQVYIRFVTARAPRVAGFSNKMIARELHIAEGTVKVHLAGAFGKLGIHNRVEAAVRGASEGRTECARWPFSTAVSSAITPPSSMCRHASHRPNPFR